MTGASTLTRDDLKHWITREALAYWEGLRRGRRMPARRDIDPSDIRDLLPHLMLFDVLREPLDFRYRLIGTHVESFMSRSYTGRLVSEFPQTRPGSVVWANCLRVLETRAPLVARTPYVGPKRDYTAMEDLIMPLSEDGDTVTMLFVAVAYVWKSEAGA